MLYLRGCLTHSVKRLIERDDYLACSAVCVVQGFIHQQRLVRYILWCLEHTWSAHAVVLVTNAYCGAYTVVLPEVLRTHSLL